MKMRVLFAISVASFCTVLWLALALARRIRRDREGRKRPSAPVLATEFFEAGEFRTPRTLRLNQDVPHQGLRSGLNSFGWSPPIAPRGDSAEPLRAQVVPMPEYGSLPPAAPSSSMTPSARQETPPPGTRVQLGAEAMIVNAKLQFVPASPPRPAKTAPANTAQQDISAGRKSPQPARSGSFRRVDLSHYNKELGDLTDPYTHSARGAEIRQNMAKNG